MALPSGFRADPGESAAQQAVRVAVWLALTGQHDVQMPPDLEPTLVAGMRLTEVFNDVPTLSDETRTSIHRLRDAERCKTLMQVRQMHRIHDLLVSAGVRWLSIKGPALSVQTCGSPFGRGFGDIDVFISPDDALTFHRVMQESGWPLGLEFPAPGETWAWRHVRRTYYEMFYNGPVGEIDVHWRLDAGGRTLPGFEECWQRRSTLDLFDVEFATLSLQDSFRHSCSHAAKDDWQGLRSLVDIHRLATSPHLGPMDLRPVDAVTLAVVDRLLPLPESTPEWVRTAIAGVRASRLDRALGQRHRTTAATPGAGSRTMTRKLLRSSTAPTDFLRVLYGVLIPGHVLVDLDDRHAVTALPRAIGLRTRQVVSKVRSS